MMIFFIEESGTLGGKEKLCLCLLERERNNKKAKERNQTTFEKNKPTNKKLTTKTKQHQNPENRVLPPIL